MHRQPYRRRFGLRGLDAMADVRGDLDPIAGPHVERHVAFLEAQAGGASQQHDELIIGLVVPEARRTRLPGRDDAFDAPAALLDEKVDVLLRLTLRQRR
jgi:hypothetical protein